MKISTLALATSLLFVPVHANNSSLIVKNQINTETIARLQSAMQKDDEIVTYLKTLKVNELGYTMADRFSSSDRKLVTSICANLNITEKDFYKAIYNESKGSTTVVNNKSGATGIIQWLPSTAILYGTTAEEIKTMTMAEQLVLAEKYFLDKGRLKNSRDIKLALLCPKALGKSNYHVVADTTSKYGKKVLEYYKEHDVNHDNVITVEELLYKKNTQSTAEDTNVGGLDTEQITNV